MRDPFDRIVIVADDLTGAVDSAAYLATAGSVAMPFGSDGPWPVATVLTLDTESREIPAADAARVVGAVVARAAATGAQVVKKIDSILRGNVAVEIDAARRALAAAGPAGAELPLVVLAPAFPGVGRTTVGGVVLVHGEPLTTGAGGGDLGVVLGAAGLTSTILAAPPDPATVTAAIERATTDALVVDAETDADLDVVVRGAVAAGRPTLLVGSGGLARPFAGLLDRSGRRDLPALAGPVLVVVGSHSPVALAQQQVLAGQGVPVVAWRPGEHDRVTTGLVRALETGAAVLAPDRSLPVDLSLARAVADGLADAALAVLPDLGTLVGTGGETARAILARAGVDHLQVRGELEPGLVVSTVAGRALSVVTKAGAFGDERALARVVTRAGTRRHR